MRDAGGSRTHAMLFCRQPPNRSDATSKNSPAGNDGRRCLFVSKSSGLGLRHQKRPDFKQHFLKRLLLPHGQRSFRPSFSSRSLPP